MNQFMVEVSPLDAVQAAANSYAEVGHTPQFQIQITGTIEAFEVDGTGKISIRIRGRDIELTHPYVHAWHEQAMPDPSVKIYRLES